MKRFELLSSLFGFEEGFDQNKFIALFTIFFAAGILLYATYARHDEVGFMFAVFMGIGCGLRVSKGVVDTIQGRKQKKPALDKEIAESAFLHEEDSRVPKTFDDSQVIRTAE